jgi:hypothetical protein
MRVSGDHSPPTGSSVRAHAWELSLLKVHHQAESQMLSGADPGPAGFNFVLPDDDPGAEALWGAARSLMWRNAWMKDDW